MANYAIISLGGKQYVVKEGESLLVDRLDREEGKTFQPDVLFLGGRGKGELAPKASVTAKVVGHERGPKIRIGKYRPKSGYRRHTGFRAKLSQIEIESIGTKRAAAAKKEPAKKGAEAPVKKEASAAPAKLPAGYADLTVKQISEQVGGWSADEVAAALEYEQAHAKRKGALAALEAQEKN
jgi:large subunit ribosomal protein L21